MRIRGHQRWYRNSMRGPSGDATSEMSSMHSLSARRFLESEHIAQSVWRFFLPGTQRRRGSIVDFLKALPCPLCGVVEIAQRRSQLPLPVARSAGAQHLLVTWQARTVCAPSNAQEAKQEAQRSGTLSSHISSSNLARSSTMSAAGGCSRMCRLATNFLMSVSVSKYLYATDKG